MNRVPCSDYCYLAHPELKVRCRCLRYNNTPRVNNDYLLQSCIDLSSLDEVKFIKSLCNVACINKWPINFLEPMDDIPNIHSMFGYSKACVAVHTNKPNKEDAFITQYINSRIEIKIFMGFVGIS